MRVWKCELNKFHYLVYHLASQDIRETHLASFSTSSHRLQNNCLAPFNLCDTQSTNVRRIIRILLELAHSRSPLFKTLAKACVQNPAATIHIWKYLAQGVQNDEVKSLLPLCKYPPTYSRNLYSVTHAELESWQ